jgi:hypothetical protein
MEQTESPMQGYNREFNKVQGRLDSQRGKAEIDLSDAFIGDEGCALVA